MNRNPRHSTLALILLLFFVACGKQEKEIEVQSIAISQPSAEMEIGETLSLKATVSPSNASYNGMNWTSTKPKVASVSESGLVSAISEGNTIITVMAGGKTASCSVAVVKGFVAVTSISLNETSLEMIEGETKVLTASVLPDDASDKMVIWTSSREDIATVEDGIVTAVSAGEAEITAKAGNQTALCIVTVQKKIIVVESIELNKTELSLFEGETETLFATVKPDDATEKSVTWISSNEGVATVKDGVVLAVSAGEATITAKAGDKSSSCIVVIKKFIPVTSISLNKTSLELEKGETETLIATISPTDATDQTITWSSSVSDVVSVDQNGDVTAIRAGNAVITAKIGDITATCSVTVIIPVESVSLDITSLTLLEGQSAKLTATVYPSDATDQTITWSSSAPSIVTVLSNGLIIAADIGSSIITATAGSKKAECTVMVDISIPEAVDLGLSVKWASFNLGASKPEEYGGYFAWGEIRRKVRFEWSNYLWGTEPVAITKYNAEDNKTVLDLEDDAARVKLGGSWRMPTSEEIDELLDLNNCSWTWQKNYNGSGINGYLVTSRIEGFTDKSIFLPAAGKYYSYDIVYQGRSGYYWSSSVGTFVLGSVDPKNAKALCYDSSSVGPYSNSTNELRFYGYQIRPVKEE